VQYSTLHYPGTLVSPGNVGSFSPGNVARFAGVGDLLYKIKNTQVSNPVRDLVIQISLYRDAPAVHPNVLIYRGASPRMLPSP